MEERAPEGQNQQSGAPTRVVNGTSTSGCPANVLAAIYGTDSKDKKVMYEESLKRWWTEYADRKNDESDEYVANSLLYDRNHLPRSAPAPDCVLETRQGQQQQSGNHSQ